MTQIFNDALEASNSSHYASGAEKDVSDSHILSPLFRHTSRNSVSKPGKPDWIMNSCLDETDHRALEQAENEGMVWSIHT